MTHAEAVKQKTDEMLASISGYLRKRFLAEPDLTSIHFSSTHKLCSTLIAAGVSLWTYSDAGIAQKLSFSCRNSGPVRGSVYNGVWVFYRHDYE